MISPSLQERIHRGDRDAFRALYSEYSRDVYLTAREALQSDATGARSGQAGVFCASTASCSPRPPPSIPTRASTR